MSTSPNPEPNPNPNPAPPAPAPADPPPPGDPTGVTIPKARFDEVNERMKAAERELADARAAQAKVDEDRLAAEKRFEDLATKRAGERDEWKGKAEAADVRATGLETRLHAIADERVKALPEKLRARVPAADKASAEDRIAQIELIEETQAAVLADSSTPPVPPPGDRPNPKPGGGQDPTKEREAIRDYTARQNVYVL